MRKRVRKSLTFLLALAMILSVFCGSGMFVDAEETTGAVTASGTEGENVEVTSLAHEKYITKNPDGTYDLTLTVAGAAGSSTIQQKLDVLLILDKSGSMQYSMTGTSTTRYNNSRWYNAKLAINELITSLEANENLDTRYSIVTFSGSTTSGSGSGGGHGGGNQDSAYNDAVLTLDWSPAGTFTLSETLSPNYNTGYDNGNGILDFTPSGGTNYQAGLREGNARLETARSDAQKVVIFLSDGEATYYYDEKGMTTGSGSADADKVTEDWWGQTSYENKGSCSQAAYAEAEKITGADYFYTIGLGNASAINLDVLQGLSERVKTANPSCTTNADNAPFMCSDLTALKNAFAEMVGEITKFACSNVTITDNLSENVNIIGTGAENTVTPDDFTITVLDESGNPTAVPVGITAAYDAANDRVVLDFPDDYELEAGYVYRVTFKVQPSELAYQKYAQTGYTDKGGTGTGQTSEGQDGFFSNDSAVVSYTYKGEAKSEDYNRPVVQVDAGKVTVTKQVTGLSDAGSADKEFEFTITNDGGITEEDYVKYLQPGSAGEVNGNVLTLRAGESAAFIYKTGTTFTFTEDTAKAEVTDYDLTVENGVVSGKTTETGTMLTVTNAYQPSNRTLTITKQVEGNMGDTGKEFSFTLALEKGNAAYTADLPVKKNGTENVLTADGNAVYCFTLKHEDSIELTIPYGCDYTITEAKEDYLVEINGVSDADGVTGGTLTEDTVIDYTNTRSIHTPTGVIRTMTPFFIMCASALGIAVILIVRRKRPWQ